jgi:type II secretory pathway component PulC
MMIGTIPLAMQWEQMAMPSGGRAASEKGASWTAGVVAALLAMSLSVAIIRTLTASSVTPRLQPTDPDASTASALPPVSVALDVSKLASMMGLPPPGDASRAAPILPENVRAKPTRSPLPVVLVGTAVAMPARYSLCQLRSTESGSTLVYAIGDRIKSGRIYSIARDRVLIENAGLTEYIDRGPSTAAEFVGSGKYSPALEVVESEPFTPHG